jgi:ATP-binding cassette, subfamily C, bacterial CydC
MRVLRRVLAFGSPPWGRLGGAAALGLAAALATIGLLAGSGYLVDRAAQRPGLGAIAGILALVEVVAVMRAPLRYRERLVAHDAAFRALRGWRVWLYDCLSPRVPAALAGWRSGDLLARAIDDVDALQDLYLRVLLPGLVAVAAGVLGVVVTGLVLPSAALILGLSLAGALVLPPAVAVAGAPSDGEAALRGSLAADVADLVQGAPDLVAFGHDAEVLARIESTSAALARRSRRRALATGTANGLGVLCLGAAVVGVLADGVSAAAHHQLNPVMLAVLPLVAIGTFEAVLATTAAAGRWREVRAAARRLLELGDLPIPVADPPSPQPVPDPPLSLSTRHARLRYAADLPWALDDLSLAVAPAERVALTGSSGSGKTSLVNVLLRFWELDGGDAALGGTPLERLAQHDVRRHIALVDQEAYLFSGTIADNLRLARPDAGPDELEAAVRLARLDEWVAGLGDGLSTPVGEMGRRVSGGQRQRIALARALLTEAPVVVLDEPTSGLDEAAALELLADVLAATQGRTVLLVTHRDAEAALFDRRVIIEAGRVVATGRPVQEPGSAPGSAGTSL